MKTNFLTLLVLVLAACRNGLAQPFPAELRIDHPPAGPLRLELLGEAFHDYSIETADALGTNGWSPLYTFSLPADSRSGFYPVPPGSSQRFFRAVSHDGPAPAEAASNFRLIDHQGKSRELNYHWTDTNVAAFVLVFTASGCAAVLDFLPALNALRSRFEPQKVRFWMINSQPQDSRSNIVADAGALGLTLPVLHDRAQLVARAYHATTAPEVMIVGRGDDTWTIIYRGAIDDRSGTNAMAQAYLADALAAHLTGGALLFKRTPADGCAVPLASLPPVSYATDIAPLLQAKCVRCHSPGNIGPFAMTSYDVVQSRAPDIRYQVMAGHMPPWHADPEYGVFTNDFSLKPTEAAKLVKWIDEGALRGDGPDPLASYTPSLEYPYAWPAELGPPDAILTYPLQSIAAAGIEPYRTVALPSPFPSNVWLRAVVVLPSNPRGAHHELAYLANRSDSDSLGAYNPGMAPWVYPAGTHRLVPQGASIEMSLHYVTSGTPQTDQPRVGFYLVRDNRPLEIQNTPIGWATDGFGVYPAIQPYARDDVRTITYTFGNDSYLYQMHPHMHLRGAWMTYEAIYPGGATEVLLSVPHFHAHWQTMYRFAQPKRMPSGTTLRVTGAFDNSAQNVENPAPFAVVNWGDQLEDEMFYGYIHFAETLTLRSQPQSRSTARGSTVSFSISATTPNPPLRYQWRLNGADISGATAAGFTITNAQSVHEGNYSVAVGDLAETLLSQPASLVVGDRPVIIQQPQSQTNRVGETVTLSVTTSGTLPISYRWRKGSTTLTNMILNDTNAFLRLNNVQMSDAASYTVAITNRFGNAPLSSNAVLTINVP